MDQNAEDYNNTINKFEPIPEFKMNASDSKSLQMSAITSIAISLKRIADKLELSQKQPTVMTAEEALNYYKLCDGC
jgi:flagellar basal body-associated protein FliL